MSLNDFGVGNVWRIHYNKKLKMKWAYCSWICCRYNLWTYNYQWKSPWVSENIEVRWFCGAVDERTQNYRSTGISWIDGIFWEKGYITSTGKVKYTMKNALKNITLDLPKKYEAARDCFTKIIIEAYRKPRSIMLPVMFWSVSINRLCFHQSLWSYGIKSSRKQHIVCR